MEQKTRFRNFELYLVKQNASKNGKKDVNIFLILGKEISQKLDFFDPKKL